MTIPVLTCPFASGTGDIECHVDTGLGDVHDGTLDKVKAGPVFWWPSAVDITQVTAPVSQCHQITELHHATRVAEHPRYSWSHTSDKYRNVVH